ncbi:MAG: TM2 domain-containing protein [Tannerellaceae bacterium]|nr:TM2 domain-containing protein [Tannerellaceae bacterium]
MDAQKVDIFLMINGKYFESYDLYDIREKLLSLDEEKGSNLTLLQFKDPVLMLIISLFGGQFGIDRFILGDTGLGICKLLTCGGFGIWAIVDWFLIMAATKQKNKERFIQALYY